jgi:hypothetical protein
MTPALLGRGMGLRPDSHRPKTLDAQSALGQLTNVCAGIAALVLAAIFFIVSTMIVREGRRPAIRFGGAWHS